MLRQLAKLMHSELTVSVAIDSRHLVKLLPSFVLLMIAASFAAFVELACVGLMPIATDLVENCFRLHLLSSLLLLRF